MGAKMVSGVAVHRAQQCDYWQKMSFEVKTGPQVRGSNWSGVTGAPL